MAENTVRELLNLTGKVALVTGAANGIGKAIALLLAQAGANVAVADIDIEGAKNTASEIEKSGAKALAIQADVSKKDQIESMVKSTAKGLNGIDILINNAAIFPPKPHFFELDENDWDRVYELNTKGVFLCTKIVAQQMVEQDRGGRIVNIGSFEGVKSLASGMAHYEASKASILMLTKTSALYLARYKINVNAVAPGVIETQGVRDVLEKYGTDPEKAFTKRIPLRRLGTPEDVANGVLFLCAKASDYITGECLFIDGGIVHT